MRGILHKISIGTKVNVVVYTLILVSIVVGAIGTVMINRFSVEIKNVENSLQRSFLGERLNGQVLSVVADSRGIYMSATLEEAAKYSKPLLATLEKIKATVDEHKALMPKGRENEMDEIRAKVNEFIAFRTELARLSKEASVGEAREFGDNDANRSNRKKLNELIVANAEASAKEVTAMEARLEHFKKQALYQIVGVVVIGSLLGLLLGFVVARHGIVRPLSSIRDAMTAVAEGDLEIEIPGETRRDELGEMAKAIAVFKRNAIERRELDAQAQRAQKAKEIRQERIERILSTFNSKVAAVVSHVSDTSKVLSKTAERLSATSQRTSEESNQAAATTNETSQNVQSVASAAEEMGTTVQEIASQVSRSTTVVNEALDKVTVADKSADALLKTSESIDAVTAMIESIAGQINLLALNATIESARAGEAGKGFAVVASEVKNLAMQATKATEQIRAQLETVKSMSQSVAQGLGAVKSSVGKANEFSSAIAAAVEEQSAATREIVKNMQVAARGVEQINNNMSTIRQSANDSSNATGELLHSSQSLLQQSVALDAEVKAFISDIQEAQAS